MLAGCMAGWSWGHVPGPSRGLLKRGPGASGVPLGGPAGAPWQGLGASWVPSAKSGGFPGASRRVLWASWALLGRFWGPLGGLLGGLGASWGPPWIGLGSPGPAVWEAGGFLGPSRTVLGRPSGPFGGYPGRSQAVLSCFQASLLRNSKISFPPRRERHFWASEGLVLGLPGASRGLLGASWGGPGASWALLGGPLGPHGGILGAILRLKLAQDRRRWPKIAPKHESLVKYEGPRGARVSLIWLRRSGRGTFGGPTTPWEAYK